MMNLSVFAIFHTCMPSCTRHTWASMCLQEQMCVCLLNQPPACAVISSPDDGFVYIFYCSYMHDFVHSSYVREHVLSRADVCCINTKLVLFYLALMIDLCVFSISFVHLSYVSECVLARAHVCPFAEWMLFVVLSSPDDGFVVFQFFIHACLRALVIRERAYTCTSRCVYVCCINNKIVLFHLALVMDLRVFSIFFVHLWYVSECVLAWAHVCIFAEWMMFVILSSPDDGFVVFQFLIHACFRALVMRERDVSMFAGSITSLCFSI